MHKGKPLIFACVLAALLCSMSTSSRATDETECNGSALDAVTILPSPLRKWGQIVCTPFGHELRSRDGWIWASLEDISTVHIPSQMVARNPSAIGNESYFTAIEAKELPGKDAAFALATFSDGLHLDEVGVKSYRVTLTSVSGGEIAMDVFDFGTFAGAMWCPDDGCVSSSRFLIMQDSSGTKSQPPSI
jgi:hypothetical protein